jgi:hypothetical protein
MENNNLKPLSSGEPTYWPTDREKVPDLIDYFVTKGIPSNLAVAKSCLELSSGHSPLLFTLAIQSKAREPQPRICNRKQIGTPFAASSSMGSSIKHPT